jgi:Ca-activated chloride channel family protein
MADPLFSVKIQGSREAIAALKAAQILYLLVDIKPPQKSEIKRLPLNLCLVIDRSTSMKGARLHHVRAAASALLDKLLADDIVTIVAFSDWAEVILPPQKIESTAKVMTALNTITASGGTEMFSGLRAGIIQLKRTNLETHNNHLILLTDGHTYGDETTSVKIVREAADEGIDFSAFGIGSEWNDRFLDELVSYSGGQSIYIESPQKVISYMEQRVEGIGRIYAQNVRLKVDFAEGIKLKSAFKVNPFAQQLSVKEKHLNLGAVEGRRPLSILLEFVIPPLDSNKSISIPVQLLADIPSQLVKDRELKLSYDLEVADRNPLLQPPDDIIDAVKAMNFHRMNELAWQDIKNGDIEKATTRLQMLSTRLLEDGHTKMAQRVLSEADRLMTWGSMSGEGRKAIKYGTRALLEKSRIVDQH